MTESHNARGPLRCPVHFSMESGGCILDCFILRSLQAFDRDLVDGAIEAVADTYDRQGQDIWWKAWFDSSDRQKRLEWALTLTGQVAT